MPQAQAGSPDQLHSNAGVAQFLSHTNADCLLSRTALVFSQSDKTNSDTLATLLEVRMGRRECEQRGE